MLTKITNIIFAVIVVILLILVVTLFSKTNDLEKENLLLLKKKSEQAVIIAEKTTQLNNKIVEVVHVPSVRYEEKIIQAKPIIEYVTKETIKIIDRPVYSNMCFDSDGLHLTNALIQLNHTDGNTTASKFID